MSAELIVLNGPPGVGKTTVATELSHHVPFSLHLDVDSLKGMISSWGKDHYYSGTQARRMAEVLASLHLAEGHRVIISQLYGQPSDIERLRQVAEREGANFYEIVLMLPKEEARQAFLQRGGAKSRDLGSIPEEVEREFEVLYDRLAARLEASNPREFQLLQADRGEIDKTVNDVIRIIGSRTSHAHGDN
jgi:predicted kinase